MVKINFKDVPDAEEFEVLPDGEYMVEVSGVEEKETKGGDTYWNLKHVVIEGEHEGRFIFDNITFNDKGLPRVKLVFSRLGIDVSGKIEIEPEDLVGERAYVTVAAQEYDGKTRSKVEFAGYRKIDDEGEAGEEEKKPAKSSKKASNIKTSKEEFEDIF